MTPAPDHAATPARPSTPRLGPGCTQFRELETPASSPAPRGLLDARSDELRRLVQEVARLADRGRLTEAWAMVEGVVDRETPGGLPGIRVALLLEAVRVLVHLGRSNEALPRALRALSLAEHHGLVDLAAAALQKLGYVQHRRGDLSAARNAYEEAYARFRRLGDEAGGAAARNNLALVLKNLGEWVAAEAHLVAALEHARRTGRGSLVASRALNLAVLRLKRGDVDAAAAPLEEARAGAARADHAWTRTTSALAAGWRARLMRRHPEAEKHLQQALELALSGGLRREETIALEYLADVALDRGQPGVAASLLARALKVAGPVADAPDLACEILHRVAACHLAEGRHAQAREALERSAALAEELKDPYEQARIALVAADLARSEGRPDEERAKLGRAVALLDDLGEWRERGRALARLAALDRDPAHARLLVTEARFLALRAGDTVTIAALDARGAAPAAADARRAAADRAATSAAADTPELVGACPAIARARELLAAVAAARDPVLLVGESGTGKDHAARAIHAAGGGRAVDFLVVDASSLRDEEFRAALQAADRRARRGAKPGSIYVDRLDELGTEGQRALLELIEHGLGDTAGAVAAAPRLLASASPGIRDAVDRGRFRSELFYRMQSTTVMLPPLRKRGEDVILLAEALLSARLGTAFRLEGEARRALLRHDWPGNVRELQHVLGLAATVAPGADAEALSAAVQEQLRRVIAPPPAAAPLRHDEADAEGDPRALRQRLRDLERDEIEQALRATSGNRSRSARLLRVSRKTLYARMRRLGIEPPPRST